MNEDEAVEEETKGDVSDLVRLRRRGRLVVITR